MIGSKNTKLLEGFEYMQFQKTHKCETLISDGRIYISQQRVLVPSAQVHKNVSANQRLGGHLYFPIDRPGKHKLGCIFPRQGLNRAPLLQPLPHTWRISRVDLHYFVSAEADQSKWTLTLWRIFWHHELLKNMYTIYLPALKGVRGRMVKTLDFWSRGREFKPRSWQLFLSVCNLA